VHLFVDGINTAAQGQAIWNYYCGSYPGGNQLADQYLWYENAANEVVTNTLVGINSPTLFSVTGYSAGGPVGVRTLTRWLRPFPSNLVAWITAIGCPKSEYSGQPIIGVFNDFAHWQNTDDPVPLIPPSLPNLDRFFMGISIGQGRRLASFDPWPRGIGITLTSNLVPSQTPNVSVQPPGTQIGVWLQEQTAGIENAHSISVYRSRLELAVSRLPASQTNIPGDGGIGGGGTIDMGEVRRSHSEFTQTIFNDATRQNAQPVNIPNAYIFTTTRIGKIYYVLFNGKIVAIAPYKRRARGMARIGNDLLRRLQNEAVVNPDEMINQLRVFMNAASDPAGGFTPIMNIQP